MTIFEKLIRFEYINPRFLSNQTIKMTSTENNSYNCIEENLSEKTHSPVEHSETSPSETGHDVTQNDSLNDRTPKNTQSGEISSYCRELRNPRSPGFSSDLNYELLYSVGIDPQVGFVNLGDEKRDDICFVSGDNLVLYNLVTREYRILPGHVCPVSCLKSDASGQYVMTSSSREIIVWDSFLAKPILSLSSDKQSNTRQIPFVQAAISKDFHFVWAFNPHHLYVWNISLVKRNIQANYVHTLTRPIQDEIVEVHADPDDNHHCIVISLHKVHFLRIEQQESSSDQDLVEYVSGYRAGRSGTFTCGAFMKGSRLLFIGTQDGGVTEWAASEEPTQAAIDSSYRKRFVRKIKLPYFREGKREVSVTALLCTDCLVIAGSSHGEITFLTSRLQLLYWVQRFGVTVVKTLRMLTTRGEGSETSEKPADSHHGVKSDIQSDFTHRVMELAESFNLLPGAENSVNSNPWEYGSSGDTNSSTEAEEYDLPAVQKHDLEMYREPHYGSTSSTGIPVNDFIVLGDKEEILQLDFMNGLYWTILESKLSGISHVAFHPRKDLMYVLCGGNMLEVIHWRLQRRLHRRRIRTALDVGESEGLNVCKHQRKFLCEILHGDKAPAEKQEEITCLHCAILFDFTLLLCGLENGLICILDGDTLTTLYRLPASPNTFWTSIPSMRSETLSKYSPTSKQRPESQNEKNVKTSSTLQYDCSAHSPVISILSNKHNVMLAAAHQDGTIALYDMLELTELRLVAHYKAHDKVTDLLMDDACADGTTVISIGTDRMCYIQRVTKTLDSDGNLSYDSCARISRIEQFAQPLFIRIFPRDHFTADVLNASLKPVEEDDLYLIGNSAYKYRFYEKSSMTCVKTVQSPVLRSPVTDFRLIPTLNAGIFTTQTEIGVQILPLTPLTYGHIYFTLPKSTASFYLIKNTGYLVTIGNGKECEKDLLLLWKIATHDIHSPSRHFEFMHELIPYYEMIPGGCYGNVYTNIKDTFVYFTIQGACHKFPSKAACLLNSEELGVRTTIDPCDLPFILSALGFFPSEFDLKVMTAEVQLMGLKEVDFPHFLILYLNHRPVRDVTYEEVVRALEYFYTCGLTSEAEIASHNGSCQSNTSRESLIRGSQNSSLNLQELGGKTTEKLISKADKVEKSNELAKSQSRKFVSSFSHLFSSSSRSYLTKSNPYLTKSYLEEILKEWSEVKWSEDQARECVGFLFERGDSLEVAEIASQLVAPRSALRDKRIRT